MQSTTFNHPRPQLLWMRLTIVVCFMVLSSLRVVAQTSSFTYNGRLNDGGTPANGNYDLQFALWDSLSGGTQIGSTLTLNTIAVSNGVFTVSLDFGAANFTGANRFLEISVRPSGGGSFTTLAPRQQITSTPYSIRTLNATTADGLSNACVNCVQDSQINQVAGSKVNGALPVSAVPGGSANYIQNSTPQAGSSFNISGDGTAGGTVSANVVNAVTQYNQGGSRVLSATPAHLLVGWGAGGEVPSGATDNTFVGNRAGKNNTTGANNDFFGENAGLNNTTGSYNTFFGELTGEKNSTGFANSFFGSESGKNLNGNYNTVMGNFAGSTQIVPGAFHVGNGSGNTLIGYFSGSPADSIGDNNTMIGVQTAGVDGITNATAIGGNAQVTQSNSLVLGSIKGVNSATADTQVGIGTTAPAATLSVVGPAGPMGADAPAVGADAPAVLQIKGGNGGGAIFVPGSGSNVLIQAGNGGDNLGITGNAGGRGGSILLMPGAKGSSSTAGLGFDGGVGIGTTAPHAKLDVAGNAFVGGSGFYVNNLGAADLQIGLGLEVPGTPGQVSRLALQPYGHSSGPWIFRARDDATKAYLDWVYGGATTGITQDNSGNVGIGTGTPQNRLQILDSSNTGLRVDTATSGGKVASFGGNGAFEIDAPGISGGRFEVTEAGNVGIGTAGPATKLQVRGDIRVGLSALNGGCVQRFDGTAIAGACSSDVRFKRNITPFPNLLNKLTQLRPVNYYWRSAVFPGRHFGSSQSYGLVAQEVERVLPELVGEDEQGYKTVDYSKLPLMLLQAVKELRAENDSLRQQNAETAARLKQIEKTIHRHRRLEAKLRPQ